MRDDSDRFFTAALLLLGSALAGFAFSFALRRTLREMRAELARQRFRVVRGSFGDGHERPPHLLRDE